MEGFTITPLPLSPQRQRSRGFNQSALIARRLAPLLNLPYEENILRRVVHGKPQAKPWIFSNANKISTDASRWITTVQRKIKRSSLVDDVTTSGTTFNRSGKRCLKTGGAKKIFALAVARALKWIPTIIAGEFP